MVPPARKATIATMTLPNPSQTAHQSSFCQSSLQPRDGFAPGSSLEVAGLASSVHFNYDNNLGVPHVAPNGNEIPAMTWRHGLPDHAAGLSAAPLPCRGQSLGRR